jgi:hypothetical protein
MSALHAVAIVIAVVATASVTPQAWAASDRSSRFTAPNWPDETIYRPECRIVLADGTWLPCGGTSRDW